MGGRRVKGDVPSWWSQVMFLKGSSAEPMAYQMQASQWAIKANVAINSSSTAAPYSEYLTSPSPLSPFTLSGLTDLSSFRATRTRRSSRAVFSSPISVVV